MQALVEVGADPDLDGGRVVGGALVRELRVTTARQLAKSLGRECILSHLQKVSVFTTSDMCQSLRLLFIETSETYEIKLQLTIFKS